MSASPDPTLPTGTRSAASEGRLQELYAEQYQRIYRLCLGYLRNAADAQDAAQESFARAARHLDRLSGDPSAYLTAIARNVCCDELRHRARRGGGGESAGEGLGTTVDAEQCAILRSTLVQAWRRLRTNEKEHLLGSFAGYSYDEMARRSGCSVTAIASVVSRARRRARDATEEVAMAMLPAFGLQRLGIRLRRRVEAVPADMAATGGLSLQQAALLVATVVTGLVGGLAAPPVATPTTARDPSVSLLSEGYGETHMASPHGGGHATPPASFGAGGHVGGSTVTTPLGSGTTLIPALLSPAPARQQDVSFSDVAYSPGYTQDRTVYASGMRITGCSASPCPALFRTTDGGTSWGPLAALGFAGGRILLPASYPAAPTVFAMGPTGLLLSNDGGGHFTAITPVTGPAAVAPDTASGAARILIGRVPLLVYRQAGTPNLVPGPVLPPDVTGVDDVAFAGSGSHVVVTGSRPDPASPGLQDGVVVDCNPTCTETLLTATDAYFHISVSPTFAADHSYFVYSPQHLYATHDGGASLAMLPVQPPGAIVDMALSPRFSTTGWLGITAYRLDGNGVAHPVLAVSADGGRTLVEVPAVGLPHAYTVYFLVALPDGRLLAGLDGKGADGTFGLRCSGDGGHVWRLTC